MNLLQRAKNLILGGNTEAHFDEAAFDSFIDSLSAIADDVFSSTSSNKGITGDPLPAKGLFENGSRVIRLDHAIETLHTFFAYALRKAFAVEFVVRAQAIKDATEAFAGKKALGQLSRLGLSKTIGSAVNLIQQLARTADRVSLNKSIALKIRRHGRDSRLDLLDVLLFGANKRHYGQVRSRHDSGHLRRSKDKRTLYQRRVKERKGQ